MTDNNKKDNKPKNGPRFLSWLYIILFIGLGYMLFNEKGAQLSGEATYTEFKEYMEKGYVDNLVVYSNMGTMDMYLKPDSAKYVFGDRAQVQMLEQPMISVGVGSLENLQEFIDSLEESGQFTGNVEYRKRSHTITDIIISVFPFVLLVVFWIILSRRMGGGAGGGDASDLCGELRRCLL